MRLDAYRYGSTEIGFWLSKKDEVRQMGSYEVVQHRFCRGIGTTSAIPEEDLNHWTILREERPLLVLVLGPRDEISLFFIFLFPLTLKGERLTTNVATCGAFGSLRHIEREFGVGVGAGGVGWVWFNSFCYDVLHISYLMEGGSS